jgi:tetratricopeptide (TPR) repeat protein
MITGTIEEARIQMNLTIEQEPYFWVVRNLDAWIYYFEEKHDRAIEACLIARDLNPDYIFTHWLLFLNYAKLGEGEKAVLELQTIARNHPEASQFPDEILNAFKKSGIPGLFIWLTDVNIHKPFAASGMSGHPFWIAWWYAILGDSEKSIYWLEKNMLTKSRQYTYFNLIATNPDFDILRDDPRFLSIIDQIGLTPYNTRKARKINSGHAALK